MKTYLKQKEDIFNLAKKKQQLNEETAKYLQTKRYEASLAKAGTNSDHKIIDTARLDSDVPVFPNKSYIYFSCSFQHFIFTNFILII